MRLLPILLVSMLLGFQAQAQPAAPPQADHPAKASTAPAHHRTSWKERFADANTTHDGHLTLEQAKAGYATVARHFAQIDSGKRGYVTQDDITAWHKQQRSARHHTPGSADDALRPRPALHRTTINSDAMAPGHDGAANDPPGQGGAMPPATNKTGASPAPGA